MVFPFLWTIIPLRKRGRDDLRQRPPDERR
jgi:hypothetical protein